MKLLKENYYIGQKVIIKNSSDYYNGKEATIYNIRHNNHYLPYEKSKEIITVKLDDGYLQDFEPFQLEEIRN